MTGPTFPCRSATPALCRLVFVLAALSAVASARADIFPNQLGPYTKSAPKTLSAPDRELDDEYGIQASESADYTSPDKKHFTATAWRFQDSTGAMAMFEAKRPPKATPSKISKLAVTTSDGVIFTDGNYLLQFTGSVPGEAELSQLYDQLPDFRQSALPLLLDALPAEGLIPNSERYLLGPVSLQRFDPAIAPSTAAFHLGAEGQLGQYETPKGKLTLAIFDYPTPNIARERYEEFAKIPGAVAKRTGPLVAVTVQPPDADAAERVLAQVRYDANVTLNQQPPVTAKQVSGMMLSIIALAGGILFLCVVGGIGLGVFRVILRKVGWLTEEANEMTVLHLSNK
jgi:hypothetical protein